MSDTVIQVENLGKKYIIGHQQPDRSSRYVALRDVVADGTRNLIQRIKNPFKNLPTPTREEFWALKNVSFEVKQGECVGIIGRNGAGKSTLLKILSRITEPTEGRVKIRGRVASLLEVGTGFHPELTGRENIYLNGAILGMMRSEIRRKFDEIVDFAEVEKFLDTPVKHYSSGMYVRLAFAVAAHLEPEILIVDEVLAVGDAAFQKKCLGKMGDVATKEGRTVLFVSHNTGAVRQLCSKAVWLDCGYIKHCGQVEKAISYYLDMGTYNGKLNKSLFIGSLKDKIYFYELTVNNGEVNNIDPSQDIYILIKGESKSYIPNFRTSIAIFKDGIRVMTTHDTQEVLPLYQGEFKVEVKIPAFLLRPGDYSVAIGGNDGNIFSGGTEWLWGLDVASFSIAEIWNLKNDCGNLGIINPCFYGKRTILVP